jgi:hypothetical protein
MLWIKHQVHRGSYGMEGGLSGAPTSQSLVKICLSKVRNINKGNAVLRRAYYLGGNLKARASGRLIGT